MKKWIVGSLIAIGILGISGYAGYNYVLNMAAEKISHELSNDILQNPQMKKELDTIINSNDPLAGKINSTEQAQTTGDLKDKTSESQAFKQEQVSSQQDNTKQKQDIKQQNNAKKDETSKSNNGIDSNNNKGTYFDNKQQAVKFAMSRFSLSEINHIKQLASGELTPEKKAELKKIAYSRFTMEEIEAVRQAVSK